MTNRTHRLPLFVAVAAFAVYLCTLGGGVTIYSLPLAARLAGWDDAPLVGQPLLWLFTLPLHLLPAAWVPVVVKLFAAALAALILGLLVRTVQLLPWDHSWETAGRFAVALPGLTAGVMCGLEFSFWQEATSNVGELLDLLLGAGALWLLLEYKARRETRWLNAATVVWGLGMAENWVMLAALPLFVAGVIWLLRVRFFRWKVILRLAGLGLAGFSVYVLLPLANGLSPHSPWTLGQAWIMSLRQTKNVGVLLHDQFWQDHRLLTLAVAVYFLVPTLPLLVRMRDEGTRNKSDVDRFQLWLYRGLRVVLLLTCCWLAFDPVIGARQMVQQQLGAWMPMLTFDYLNALGAGFLAGNLLLISQHIASRDGLRRSRSKFRWKPFLMPVAAAGLTLMAIGLAARNTPAIWRLNFHPVEKFGAQAVKSLPAGGGVMLSDFPEKLEVFQAALAHSQVAADWLAVDMRALPKVEYRARLERRHPAGWLTDQNRHELTPLETVRLLEQMVRTNRLFYLHPLCGAVLEGFYLEPSGTVYELKLRGKDPLDLPTLSGTVMDANEQLWSGLWDKELAGLVPPDRPGFLRRKLAGLCLVPAPRFQDRLLATWFAIPLDGWGVALQKQGHVREANVRLEQALQLNTNNLSARISLACNTNLQAGIRMGLTEVDKVADELGNRDRLSLIVNRDGPFDEPTVDYLLGTSFLDHGFLLQAAEEMERVRTLVPGALNPELALVEIYNRLKMTDRGRPLILHLRQAARNMPANRMLDLNLALLESYSWLLQTNVANARSVLRSVVERHPDDPQVNARVLAAYAAFGDFTNALLLADAQLAQAPDDVTSLYNKATVLLQAGRATDALPLLDHILTLTNQPEVRIKRVFAHLAREDFALAENDLRELEKDSNGSPMVSFGLAAVAAHSHDTNLAEHYLRLCLTNTPVGAPLWQQASIRLQMLEPAIMAK
jgi:tetratricopeptide (TPR) repeat protein